MMQDPVLIVGGGGAGLCAALEVRKSGLPCLVLEADDRLGGATNYSSGAYCAAGSAIQRRKGVEDTPDHLFDYIMTLNQWDMRADIVRTMSDLSVDGLNFLTDCGVVFEDEGLCGGGRHRVARSHLANGHGRAIIVALEQRAIEAGVEFRTGIRVRDLLVEAGRVTGVLSEEGELLRGSAVILTTGGFGNDKALLARLYPSVAQHGDRTWCLHEPAPFILGDGIVMAERIGARVTGEDTGLPLPSCGFKHNIEGTLPPWIMLVNADGRRFMAETSAYSIAGYLLNQQKGGRAFAIFDEWTLTNVSTDVSYIEDDPEQPQSTPSWHRDAVLQQVEAGMVVQASTIPELADKIGVDGTTLQQSIDRYSRDAQEGVDRAFFKRTGLFPIKEAPFYAVEVRASIVGLTAAGLNIDTSGRVLDQADRVIPGLYAAGEVLGCVIGSRYAVGGLSLLNVVVFGRLAGQAAAAFSQSEMSINSMSPPTVSKDLR